ncbi:hypothetical protein LSCM1_00957 [Leishmania martiniquensis]|uniref:EF-hand domain-containing protein n=1 Tax=Leishmania martiniquensis TaxID=1580590 RepID=A0A836GXU2_9TRYP|nr:hypothetical protein LSCM1_00957 [Leishmania martiniquensis]
MPSRVFVRAQVLDSLSDDAARQEAEAIPEFIYFFLRDAFLAVDEDGDGYVTGDAVSRLFPALTSARAGNGSASSPEAPGIMAPTVHPTWWSPTSYVAPTRCATAAQQRPLDLCGFMQTYWPIVSDKMARLVGDTRSEKSSDNASRSRSPCAPVGRQPVFSPSPFRDVSAPPLRAPSTSRLAAAVPVNCLAASLVCGARPVLEGETVAPEQHRLYRQAVEHIWMGDCTRSPHSGTPSPALESPSASSPVPPPCPQHLLTENDMEELLAAFFYLDRQNDGYVGVADVAAALQSLLHAAACTGQGFVSADTPAEVHNDVEQLAHAMLRLALSTTTTPRDAIAPGREAASPASDPSTTPPALPSPPSCDPCVSWTVFARSFQCDTGAFPAELVAWCAGCARASRESTTRALATTPQWMSPLECAYVQQLLISYMDLSCAEKGKAFPRPSPTTSAKADSAPAAALSQRVSVNTASTRTLSRRCQPTGTCEDHWRGPYSCQTHAAALALQQRCHHTDVHVQHSVRSDIATLPLPLLEASLRQDMHAFLFPGACSFSAAAEAALGEVVEHHVRAVCTLARRVALLPAFCHSSDARTTGKVSPLSACVGLAHVNMKKLVDAITADPRCLHLDVLVPWESRLAAVVEGAQHYPRRLVEEAVSLLSVFAHDAGQGGGAELADVLHLRRALSALSPSLARLITGAASFCEGQWRLERCMIALTTHVLSVPPLLHVPPSPGSEETALTSASVTASGDSAVALHDHPCFALMRNAPLLKASHGWLRYTCRRMPSREQRAIIEALRCSRVGSYGGDKLCEAANGTFHSIIDGKRDDKDDQRPISACDMYRVLLPPVRASCWVCSVDPVVAAHVTLVLVAASMSADITAQMEESAWWARVLALLEQWVRANHSRCCLPERTDAWAMNAITSTAAELGLPCCREVSRVLSHLHVALPVTTCMVTVKEEELTQSLTRVVESLSLWAPPPSAKAVLPSSSAAACSRLVDTLVGACPCHEPALVDVSSLLQRWLEAYPLPLTVTHLSLCCAIEEVGSVYYALKRLAASEEEKRLQGTTPAGWTAASPRALGKELRTATASSRPAPAAPVLTGISPACLSELLGNEDLLLALYAVSPPEAVGVWGGALCRLGTLLRPVLLSSTGVRVSLDKLSGRPLECGRIVGRAAPGSASIPPLAAATFHRNGGQRDLADALTSMAVPAPVQHAAAQLFAHVDVEGTGRVTEDQLRSHRSRVPASVRYGWHRFVTALCSSSAMTSLPLSCETTPCTLIAGGLSAAVLRSHRWRCGCRAAAAPELCVSGAQPRRQPQEEEVSRFSVATQRSDDDAATTYSLGDMLVRMAELRVCVQAQLLEESSARAKAETSAVVARKHNLAPATVALGAGLPWLTATDQKAAASSSPAAGTAQWWATYLEELCRSYSPLAL